MTCGRSPLLVAAAVSAALAVAPTATAAPLTAPVNATPSAFVETLALMPAAAWEDGAVLTYVDWTVVWDRLGAGPDVDSRAAQIGRIVEPGTYAQPPMLFETLPLNAAEARAEVGFSHFEIDHELAVVAPPRRIVIATTTVDRTVIEQAMATDPVWSPDLTVVATEHGEYFGWGGDGLEVDVSRRTPLRPLGQAGQVTIVGDRPATVVRTLITGDAEAAVAVAAGTAPSLAELPATATALEALGEGIVVQAVGTGSLLVVELDDDGAVSTQLLVVGDTPGDAATAAVAAERLIEEATTPTGEPIGDLLPDAVVSTVGSVVVIDVPDPLAYRRAVRLLFERALDLLVDPASGSAAVGARPG
jgi:hypothetical protein